MRLVGVCDIRMVIGLRHSSSSFSKGVGETIWALVGGKNVGPQNGGVAEEERGRFTHRWTWAGRQPGNPVLGTEKEARNVIKRYYNVTIPFEQKKKERLTCV